MGHSPHRNALNLRISSEDSGRFSRKPTPSLNLGSFYKLPQFGIRHLIFICEDSDTSPLLIIVSMDYIGRAVKVLAKLEYRNYYK